jgi:anti-sigma B factor antagonist
MQLLSVGAEGDTLVLTLRGEIDFTNAAATTETIRSAVADMRRLADPAQVLAHGQRPARVRVDIAEVTFLDSSGIGVLVSALRAAQEAGAAFRVEHPNPNVFDQLGTAGLLEAFGLTDAEAEAER